MPDYIFINAQGHELAAEVFATPAQAHAHAEHLAITQRTAVTFAEVIAYRVQPTCMLCSSLTPDPSPRGRGEGARAATILAGDWQLCEDCYNAITSPWPGIDEPVDGEGLGEIGLDDTSGEGLDPDDVAETLLDSTPPAAPFTVSARLVFSLARTKVAVE